MASATVVCQRIPRSARGAPANESDDAAGEHEAGEDDERQEGDKPPLLGAEEDRCLLRVLGPDRDLILLLGKPAHAVEEEVAVALHVEKLVGGEIGRPIDDD